MKINGFLFLLLVIGLILGGFYIWSYNSAMAPTWAEIASKQAAVDLEIAKANAKADVEAHEMMSMALSFGSWVLVALLLGTGGILWWKEYDKRQESMRRAVDGSFALQTFSSGGFTYHVDPNKAMFGVVGFNKATGGVITDAQMTGPDRQLEYAQGVQKTRTVAAKQIAGGKPSRNELMDNAGVFDEMRREKAARAELAELRLSNQRQPDPIATPAKQLTMWTAKDAFRANTDTAFALGLATDNTIICWDVTNTPHVRVHGKSQGSGKTNLIKGLATGAILSGAHVIVADRRSFKDWSAFSPFIEQVDNTVKGAFYGLVSQLKSIYQERDQMLGNAGVGNIASLPNPPKRVFVIISEFGSACRAALDSGELDQVVPVLKTILSEAGATGVHLIFEDQAINRNWPPELRGNAEPITGYLPQDASKAGGYGKAYELDRYQFHFDGDKFKTFDMNVEAPKLLFDASILEEKDYLIDVRSFGSFDNDDFSTGKSEKNVFRAIERTERTFEPTDRQRALKEWRAANPGNDRGMQARAIRELQEQGVDISKSYVCEMWDSCQPVWNRREELLQ